MNAAPDDLDALLLSLLAPAAPAPEPVAEAAPASVEAAPPGMPELPPDAAAVQAALRAWLDSAQPGEVFNPSELGLAAPVTEPLEPEILLELVAARAWRAGDQEGFERALSRLPAESVEHHRRMAGVCDLIKTRQAERSPGPTQGGRS